MTLTKESMLRLIDDATKHSTNVLTMFGPSLASLRPSDGDRWTCMVDVTHRHAWRLRNLPVLRDRVEAMRYDTDPAISALFRDVLGATGETRERDLVAHAQETVDEVLWAHKCLASSGSMISGETLVAWRRLSEEQRGAHMQFRKDVEEHYGHGIRGSWTCPTCPSRSTIVMFKFDDYAKFRLEHSHVEEEQARWARIVFSAAVSR